MAKRNNNLPAGIAPLDEAAPADAPGRAPEVPDAGPIVLGAQAPEPGADRDFEERLASFARNDAGNAERLIARRGGEFIWLKDAGWFGWHEGHWSLGEGDVLVRLAALETARAMRFEANALFEAGALDGETPKKFKERIDRAHKWTVTSGNAGRLDAMIAWAAPRLRRAVEDLDADPFRFNVVNGTLVLGDIAQGEDVALVSHNPADLITRQSPVAYDETAAACPLWRGFLDYFLPDRTVQSFLQRWFGYCLTGSTGEQCLVLFHGQGRNGKSTCVDLMSWLMGDYAMGLPIASLLQNDRKGGSEASPDLARLPGARMVRAAEPKQGAAFDESLLKQLTGGEPMAVRHLNKGFFDFLPTFKLVLSFNRRPTVRGDDDGIWRRLLLVPWEVQLPADEVDKHFLDKLKEEAPAILNWVLDGYRMWREFGLQVPDAVKVATEDYRADSDPIGNFIAGACEIKEGVESTSSQLFTAYNAWCRRNALEPISQTAFGRRLSERKGVKKIRSGTIRYQGIAVVDRGLLGEQTAEPQ